jgi:hypothetical protein
MNTNQTYMVCIGKQIIILGVCPLWLPSTHFTLETTRARSNLVEKMQTGNFIRDPKKENYENQT